MHIPERSINNFGSKTNVVMKEELTIGHLAPYLPYGIRFIENGFYEFNIADGIDRGNILSDDDEFDINFCKLLVRPLSDVTKGDLDYMYFDIISTDNDMYGSRFEFEDYFKETGIYHLPFCLYNYLVKNHFDVDNLIEKGLAIDVNTLENNPYN